MPPALSPLPDPSAIGGYWLRALDLLRAVPSFEGYIQEIRKRLGIKPRQLLRDLRSLVPNRTLLHWAKACDTPDGFDPEPYHYALGLPIALGISPPSSKATKGPTLEEMEEAQKKVHDFEESRFPTLDVEIGKLRLLKVGRIPHTWHNVIKNYILYRQESLHPLKPRRSLLRPKWKVTVHQKTLEPYVELRIYAETNLGRAKDLLRQAKARQKALPTYPSIINQNQGALMQAWIYCTLTEIQGLDHKTANQRLGAYGLPMVDYYHKSRVIGRFKKLSSSWLTKP